MTCRRKTLGLTLDPDQANRLLRGEAGDPPNLPAPREAGGPPWAARPRTLGSMRRKLCGPRLLSVERLNVLLW